MRKSRRFQSVRQMLEALDEEFRVTTDMGLLTTCKRYLDLHYGEGGDLLKYIAIHENRALEYEETSGTMTQYGKILTLHSSLPQKYEIAPSFFRSDYGTKNYATYKCILIETHESITVMEGKSPSNLKKNTDKSDSPQLQSKDDTNGEITFRHLLNLCKLQEFMGLKVVNKITDQHIRF